MHVINSRSNLVTSMANFRGSLYLEYNYAVWHKDCRLSLQKGSFKLLPTTKSYLQPEHKDLPILLPWLDDLKKDELYEEL